jgi:carbamoyl-phosphate synthase large subunit
VVVRPSYVLGGRAMEIVADAVGLARYMREAVTVSPEHPVLVDRYVGGAVELDVDCVSDGQTVVVGGIMQHVEEAGIHSGDSACSLPPYSVPAEVLDELRRQTIAMARALGVVGLMNVQFAVRLGDAATAHQIYVLEVNPRASRTVPFVSKAIGRPLAKLAARVMAGKSLRELGFEREIVPPFTSVKESVFPFARFLGVDTILGPEMKSTGEVMGIARDFPAAFAKAQAAANNTLPSEGLVLFSMADEDKGAVYELARRVRALGFSLVATTGTADVLRRAGLDVPVINKEVEAAPNTTSRLLAREIHLVFTTTRDPEKLKSSFGMRRAALRNGIPYFTTLSGCAAAVSALESLAAGGAREVMSLGRLHGA